jgi:hypothetical protein
MECAHGFQIQTVHCLEYGHFFLLAFALAVQDVFSFPNCYCNF